MPKKIKLILALSLSAGTGLVFLIWLFPNSESQSVWVKQAATVLAAVLLFSGLACIWLYRRLRRPIELLEEAIQKFSSKGEIRKLSEEKGADTGGLFQAYNQMLEKLEENRQEVKEETKRLEAINRIVSLADLNFDQDKVKRQACQVLLDAIDLDYVAIYSVIQPSGEIKLEQKLFREGVALPDLEALRFWQEAIKKAAQTNQMFLAQDQKSQSKSGTELDLLQKLRPALAALPLSCKGTVTGLAVGASFRRPFFNPGELEIFSSICQHLSVSLENFRLYQNLRERVIEVTTFNRISQALSSILEVEQLLKELLQIITTSFGYNVCAVFLHDPERGELASKALWGYPSQIEKQGIHLSVPGPGICNLVLQKGEPVLSNDVTGDPHYVEGWPDCRSELAVPLKSGERVIGVLNVESDRTGAFAEKDVHILTTLAGQISILLQNAKLFQEQKDKTEQLLVADQINRAIASTLDLPKIFEIVYQGLQEFVEQDGMFFYFFNHKEQSFVRAYYFGNFPSSHTDQLARIPASHTNMWKVVQSKEVFVCNLLQEGKYPKAIQEYLYQIGVRSYVLVPVIDQNEVIGCYNLVSRLAHRFGHREQQIAQSVANHLAVAIKNSQMYQELKEAYENLKSAQQTLLQSEKLRSLGELTSGVVHDFNNLLATILGRTQILLQKLSQAELANKETYLLGLKAMEKAAIDGGQLLTRISQFGKAQSEADLEPVLLNEVVTDSIELTRPRWKNQSLHEGIRVSIQTEFDSSAKVLADASQLREVLINLIINALDAMPQGGDITVKTWDTDQRVWLSVQDNGSGMSPEVKNKIFQPFFTTKGKKGTGLGLAICLSIVSRFKGEIKVESELGQGTSFTLAFPKLTSWDLSQKSEMRKTEVKLLAVDR